MTWATPTLAILAAAVAVPALVILYFLKLRRRSVEISSTLLWKKAIQDLQANAPFQKLRRNILLLLQLLALAAALFAIAQPERTVGEATSARHVIMIDRSASMAALDGSVQGGADDTALTRLEAAKRGAIAQIDSLEEGDLFGADAHEAMVIAFDTTAEVVQRFTPDKARLRAAIESVTQTDVPGSIKEAFQLAQAHRPRARTTEDAPVEPTDAASADGSGEEGAGAGLIAGAPQTFHLFTDGRLEHLESFLPTAADSVIYHRIGDPLTTNVGITGLRAERAYDQPALCTVFVGVQNTADVDVVADVELLLDGVPTAIRSVTIPARDSSGVTDVQQDDFDETDRVEQRREPGRSGVVFELNLPERARATVRVRTDGDVFATDDEGTIIIPPATQTSVAVVTSGNLFLTEALAGLPLAELVTLTPAEFEAMTDTGEAERFDVVVLDGLLPPGTPEGRALAPGRWLILGAVPGSPEGVVDLGEAGFTRFLDWKRSHPVLRGLTLDPVRIGKARRIEVPETSAAEVLAETPAGPGIIELITAEARAVAVLFDVAESTWPFDVGFVVFFASAIDHLDAGAALETGGSSVRPGEILSQRLPLGAEGVRLTTPDGGEVELVPGRDGRVTWGPVQKSGVYTLSWRGVAGPADLVEGGPTGDRVSREIGVNLLDPFESDAAPASEVALASQIVSARSQRETVVRRYWRWLLLGALAIIMLEWYIYNRKVYV